jgi:hypothetical protein
MRKKNGRQMKKIMMKEVKLAKLNMEWIRTLKLKFKRKP